MHVLPGHGSLPVISASARHYINRHESTQSSLLFSSDPRLQHSSPLSSPILLNPYPSHKGWLEPPFIPQCQTTRRDDTPLQRAVPSQAMPQAFNMSTTKAWAIS